MAEQGCAGQNYFAEGCKDPCIKVVWFNSSHISSFPNVSYEKTRMCPSPVPDTVLGVRTQQGPGKPSVLALGELPA